jgi:hypothetical protein
MAKRQLKFTTKIDGKEAGVVAAITPPVDVPEFFGTRADTWHDQRISFSIVANADEWLSHDAGEQNPMQGRGSKTGGHS